MIKKFITIHFCLLFTLTSTAQYKNFKTGDLIFQVNKDSEFSNAIKETTSGNVYNYTHVGIILVDNDSTFVLEATSPFVCKTPLQDFLRKSKIIDEHYIVTVARLKTPYQKHIPKAIVFAKSALGRPYDEFFLPNNKEYYCSELVYEAFCKTNGKHIFNTIPISFKDQSGNFHEYWIKHYEKNNIPIPEGTNGSNPANLSKSSKLRIIQKLVKISK